MANITNSPNTTTRTVNEPAPPETESEESIFVTNAHGTTHNVPGPWVTVDSVGTVFVRGNAGYRLASDDEVDKWHDEQGLDHDIREDVDPSDDEVKPQVSNFTTKDPGKDALEAPSKK